MTNHLLHEVEKALCCPEGCRALAEGDLKLCGASKTKQHAEAAIAVVQGAYRDKLRALIAIQKQANAALDRCAGIEADTGAEADNFREIAKLATEALGNG